MNQARHIIIVAAAITATLGGSPAAADVKAGVDAWQSGNYAVAVSEWRPLADKGDADAQFNMGQAYKLGHGVPSNLRIAQSWYEKAAAQGHHQAQANLGLILFQGGQRAKAMPWLKLASEQGDPRAQYVFGTALFNGDLVAKDWPRAYALMTRSAAAGLPQAADSLAQMDKYIPLADRQKGVALAQALEKDDTPATAPATKAPRVAGAAIAPTKAAAPAPAPASKPAPAKPAAAAPAGKWRVQLGAYGSADVARGEWATISRKIAALSGLQPYYEPAGKLTRLRVGPLADRAAADKVCTAAKASGQACFTVAP